MKKIIYIAVILTIIISALTLTACSPTNTQNYDGKFKIVTSFYPIYIATLNITEGAENVKVENMTSNQVGCLHEYTLKTDDMLKVENANVFIQNGKGLENFIDRLTKTYPNLIFIDSSEGIEAENAHIWVNPEMYVKQIRNIAQKLSELNPENKTIYEKNATEYIDKINDELQNLSLKDGISAITFNETLENISDKIELTVIETGHEETALSASELASVINKMKNENISIILVDKNENYRNAESLKNETVSQIYELDSYTRGEINKNSYITALKENISVLNSINK